MNLDYYNYVISMVKRDSSPGYPWGLMYRDKEQALLKAGEEIYDMVNYRLKCYLKLPFQFYTDSKPPGIAAAVDFVKKGFVDPIRLFIKNEPHSIAKIRDGRFRLVSSVSIVDEIVERLLCGEQNQAEIENWLECPSKPGIGLSSDEQTNSLYQSVKQWLDGGHFKDSDVSGWDFGFKRWMYYLDYVRRVHLVSGPYQLQFAQMLKGRFVCLGRAVFVTSDGAAFAQTFDGIMKSGSYLTSSTNSASRVGLAYLLGANYAMAMGDDCGESNPMGSQRLKELYIQHGVRMSDLHDCSDNFEFCSHQFYSDRAVPKNFWKGAFRLISKEPNDVELQQFLLEYRHYDAVTLKRFISVLVNLPGWCGIKSTIEHDD